MTFSTPGGKPDLQRDLAERQRGQRRLARRLEDDGVAAGQRRRDLPRREQQREVPRHDRGDDADRLAQRVGEVVALDRNRLARHLVGPAGEVLEALGRGRDLDVPRFADRLAVVQRLEPRDLVGALHQPLAELAAPAARARAPTACPTARSSAARAAATAASTSLLSADATVGDHFLGRRVDDVHRLAGRRRTPFVVDEELIGGDRG